MKVLPDMIIPVPTKATFIDKVKGKLANLRFRVKNAFTKPKKPLELWGNVEMAGTTYQPIKIHGDLLVYSHLTLGGDMTIDGSVMIKGGTFLGEGCAPTLKLGDGPVDYDIGSEVEQAEEEERSE